MNLYTSVRAAALLLLALAACEMPFSPGSGNTPRPVASASGGPESGTGGAKLTGDACRVLTAADVRSALNVAVQQIPMTAAPPGGGADPSLFSGCTYAASAGPTVAGVSLFLFKDMPIDYFANIPGYTKVPGIGDRAYLQAPRLLGQKGHVTFQITLVSEANDPTADAKLTNLARIVAGRL